MHGRKRGNADGLALADIAIPQHRLSLQREDGKPCVDVLQIVHQRHEGVGRETYAGIIDRTCGGEEHCQHAAANQPGQHIGDEKAGAHRVSRPRKAKPHEGAEQRQEPEVIEIADHESDPVVAQHGLQQNPRVKTEMQRAVQLHEGFVPGEGLDHGDHGFEFQHALVEQQHGRQQRHTRHNPARMADELENVPAHLLCRAVGLQGKRILQQAEQENGHQPRRQAEFEKAEDQTLQAGSPRGFNIRHEPTR